MSKSNLQPVKWNIVFVAIAIVIVAADQFTKIWIRSHLAVNQSVPSDGLFRLTYAQNTGAAFSIFYGKVGILTIVSIIGVIALLFYVFMVYRRFPYLDTRINKIALGLILGGTLGNLIDRLRLGYVTDFVDIGPWPVFNVADSSLVVGVIVFALLILLMTQFPASGEKRE
jgi:signal peptidase II